MGTAKENVVKQGIKVELERNSTEEQILFKLIAEFVKKHGSQKIEGTIREVSISTWTYSTDIKIVSLIEDKLNLLENR